MPHFVHNLWIGLFMYLILKQNFYLFFMFKFWIHWTILLCYVKKMYINNQFIFQNHKNLIETFLFKRVRILSVWVSIFWSNILHDIVFSVALFLYVTELLIVQICLICHNPKTSSRYIYILNYTNLFWSRFLYFQCTVLTSNSWFLISGLYWKKFQPLVIYFLCNVNQQNLPYMIRIIILYIRKMHVVADEVYTINSY